MYAKKNNFLWNYSLNKAFFRIYSLTMKQLINALANNFYSILYKERKLILTWHSAQYQSKLSTSAHWSSVRSAQTGSYHHIFITYITRNPIFTLQIHFFALWTYNMVWLICAFLGFNRRFFTLFFGHYFLCRVRFSFLFINVLLVLGNSRPPPCLFLWVLRLLFPPYWLASFDTTFFPQSFWFFFPKFLKMSFRNSLLLIFRNLHTIPLCLSW